ncbi:MAG: hypothetical protein ACREPI_04930 [Candidatus Dormibacterales bacterium]
MNERSNRREVLNQTRRRVERALASEGPADELAAAAEALLGREEPEPKDVAALRTALTRYRRIRGG